MKKILALSASLLLAPRIILASSPLDSSEVSSLTKQWRLLSSQVESQLSQVQEQLQKQTLDLQRHLEETNRLLTEEQEKSKELQASNDSLIQQAAKDYEEIHKLRLQIADNNEENQTLRNKLALAEVAPQIKKGQIQKLKSQNKALEEENEHIRQKLLTSQTKISELDTALQSQQQQRKRDQLLAKECQREKDDLAKVLDFNTRKHEKEVADLKTELNASRSSVQCYEERYQMTFQLANDYAEKLGATTSKVEKLQQQIDELTAQATKDQKKISTYETKISDLENKADDLPQKDKKLTPASAVTEVPSLEASGGADTTDHSKTIKKQPADILSAKMKRLKIQKLSDENKRLQNENDSLTKQNQSLKEQIDNLTRGKGSKSLTSDNRKYSAADLDALSNKHSREMATFMENYSAAFARLQDQVKAKNEEIHNLKIELDQVRTQLTDRQNDILVLTRQNKAKPKTS